MLLVGSSLFPSRACGSQVVGQLPEQETKPSLQWPRCLIHSGLEFLLAAYAPGDSCTFPRRHGQITHHPEDAPYGGFGPDLPCCPPVSHGSSRFEADDRRAMHCGIQFSHDVFCLVWCFTVPHAFCVALSLFVSFLLCVCYTVLLFSVSLLRQGVFFLFVNVCACVCVSVYVHAYVRVVMSLWCLCRVRGLPFLRASGCSVHNCSVCGTDDCTYLRLPP